MSTSVGVGISKKSDSSYAGEEAASSAIKQMGKGIPDLAIVFASVRFNQSLLIKGLTSMTKTAALVGCSSAGEITSLGPDKRSVVVMVLKSDTIKFAAGIGKNISQSATQAGEEIARSIASRKLPNPHAFVMFPDGLTGNGAEIIRGIQNLLGTSFPIVGGSSADDLLYKKTYQYYNDTVFTDSVVGVLFAGNISIGIDARHGWQPLGKPRKITKSLSNILISLDGEKASSIYKDYFGMDKKELASESLTRTTILYPLGMPIPGEEEYMLRNALKVEPDGSVVYAGEVPQDAEVRLMMGSKEGALEAARRAASRAKENLKGKKPILLMIFDSVSRNKLFGRESKEEIEIVKEVFGQDIPIVGFYDYGEQAPLSSEKYLGRTHFHNETIAILALGE